MLVVSACLLLSIHFNQIRDNCMASVISYLLVVIQLDSAFYFSF